MSVPEVAYRIPSNEWTDEPAASEVINGTPDIDNRLRGDETSLIRGSAYYEQRAGLLAEEIANRNLRQEIISLGDSIFKLRQAEIERFLAEPRGNLTKRVLAVLISGQFDKRSTSDEARLRDEKLRLLTNRESEIGASLLDKPPQVGRQEFFLSPHSTHSNEWFYHAESIDQTQSSRTIRYVVSEDGVFKSVDGDQYEAVIDGELDGFINLTKRYYRHVGTRLYEIPVNPSVSSAYVSEKPDQSDYDLAA